MRKYIITAELRELEWKVSKGEISYSRMIEILCEKADVYAKMYHEQQLSKLNQPPVSGSVCEHLHQKWEGEYPHNCKRVCQVCREVLAN